MFGSFFKKRPSLERQLRDLAECGVKLLPGATPESLIAEWSEEAFEKDPYRMAVVALGSEEEARSENLWHFDTECIEDHGAYVRIAERMRQLAGDDMPMTEIADFVDVEGREAWLSFRLDGREHRWACEVDSDWVDPSVLTRFAQLLEGRRTGRRFVYLDLGGQDCVLGCFSEEERGKLGRVTGLKWEWLR